MANLRDCTFQEALQMVSDFHKATDGNLAQETRERIIEEELAEFREAFSHLMKEAGDLTYVLLGAVAEGNDVPEELLDRATMAIDMILPECAGLMNEAFHRVHESNMSKLVDGKASKRDDGKILKGPNYQPPNLDDLAPGGRS